MDPQIQDMGPQIHIKRMFYVNMQIERMFYVNISDGTHVLR